MLKKIILLICLFICFSSNYIAKAAEMSQPTEKSLQSQHEYNHWWKSLTLQQKAIIQGVDALENEHQNAHGGAPIPFNYETVQEMCQKLSVNPDNQTAYNLVLIRMSQHNFWYETGFQNDTQEFIDDSDEFIKGK